MNRKLIAVCLCGGLMACLSGRAVRGSADTVLAENQMAVLFGGETHAEMCCTVIQECKNVNVCSAEDNEAECENFPHPYDNNKQYARKCDAPPTACPTCACADFELDSNGQAVKCIKMYYCTWVLGQCKSDGYTGQGTQGYFSCADNCAP